MHVVGRSSARRYTNITRDTQRGRKSRICFTGTTTAINGIAAQLSPALNSQIDASEAPFAVLLIDEPDSSDGSAQDSQSTWELLANAVQKDIYEHPSSLEIPASYISDIKDHFEQNLSVEPAWLGGVGNPPAAALSLFELLLRGTTHYQTDQYVLRHSQVVAEGSDIEVSYAQAGLIFTTREISPGGRYDLGIPTDLLFSIGAILPIPFNAGTPSGYSWGWLHRSPQVEQVSGNKWRITDEWWFELWSIYLYQLASIAKPPAA